MWVCFFVLKMAHSNANPKWFFFFVLFNTWKLKKPIKLFDLQIIDLSSFIRIRMMNWFIFLKSFFSMFLLLIFYLFIEFCKWFVEKKFEWSDGVSTAGGKIVFESKNITLDSANRKCDERNYSLSHNARLMAVEMSELCTQFLKIQCPFHFGCVDNDIENCWMDF